MKDQHLKKDAGKLPAELMPTEAVAEMLRVLGFGAEKYAANGWREGIPYNRVLAAIYRHWAAIMAGEDRDPETGLLHAGHILCEAAFLAEYQLAGRAELDDRYRPEPVVEMRRQARIVPSNLPTAPSPDGILIDGSVDSWSAEELAGDQ